MTPEIITFVAGPACGETRAVPTLTDEFLFPVAESPRLHYGLHEGPGFRVHVYRARIYAGRRSMNDYGHWVYDYQGLRER